MDTFVLDQTRLTTLTLLPSIRLHLADEVIPVWEKSERDAPPFWAFAWPGGQALARYLLDHPDLVRGKRVLDLASGSGLVAIAAAQCGAFVVATEIDPYAIEAIKLNAAANNVRVQTHLGDVLDDRPQADVVLAGDVFYSREMAGRVLEFLARSTAELVLVGDPRRAYAPTEGFERVAEYDVPVNRDVEDIDVIPRPSTGRWRWRARARPGRRRR
jgi:predicted nicotinamide N-methyase